MIRTRSISILLAARRRPVSHPGAGHRRLHFLLPGILVLALAFLARPAAPAAAAAAPGATINVTTTGDTLDAGSGNCAAITVGSLPGPDGVTSLREAVCAANNTAGNDTITFTG